MAKDKDIICSFCGNKINRKDIKEGKSKVFIGTDEDIVICENCVQQCVDIMSKDTKKELSQEIENFYPSEIKNHLDKWIIGQEEAKKTLAIALYNHYKRINQVCSEEDKIQKSNVMLVGHTGSGKTALVEALARIAGLPLVIEDVTSISTTGYIGRDVDDILKNLLMKADGDIKKAQRGIVLLDEGDKLKREKSGNGQRDVKGEGVQQSLLKMVEGGVFDVKVNGHKTRKFDTRNVLFILSGAFENIDKIIEGRIKESSNVGSTGFTGNVDARTESQKYNDLIVQVKHEDLKKFGMMPELLGRFPVVTAVQELSEEALKDILVKPKNAIVKQYKELFAEDDVDLEFSDEALLAIAKEAKKRKIGARALRSILEEVLKKPMFEVPGNEEVDSVVIDKDLNAQYLKKELEQEDLEEETNI